MTEHTPGYLIGNFTVTDPALMAEYGQKATPLVQAYGGEVTLTVSGLTPLEGQAHSTLVVIRFPNFAQAEAFYHDPAYGPVKELRLKATTGGFLALIPGLPA
nr:DUF1330 domain-containing protein [uncultured Neokomagataea sp.]